MPEGFDSINYVNTVAKQLLLEYEIASTGTTPVLIGNSREFSARKN